MKPILVKMLMLLSISGFMGLMTMKGAQIVNACGVCEIFWDSGEATCDTTNGSGAYEHTLNTRGSSSGHDEWTLLQKVSKLSGSNVTNVNASPSSTKITEISGIAEFNVATKCTGNLIDTKSNGFSDLNAWDSTCFACSDGHRVDIMKVGDSCPP